MAREVVRCPVCGERSSREFRMPVRCAEGCHGAIRVLVHERRQGGCGHVFYEVRELDSQAVA